MKNTQTMPIHRGQIYYVDLGEVSEKNSSLFGKIRPCVIVSNNVCNKTSTILTCCCISSKISKDSKKGRKMPTHVLLSAKDTNLKHDSICMAEQPISISKNQLLEKIGKVTESDMCKISAALRIQLAI